MFQLADLEISGLSHIWIVCEMVAMDSCIQKEVLKNYLSFHYTAWFIGIPLWIILIPNILGRIIQYNHQPTEGFNTAQFMKFHILKFELSPEQDFRMCKYIINSLRGASQRNPFV